MNRPVDKLTLNLTFLKRFEHNDRELFQALAEVRRQLDESPYFGLETSDGAPPLSYPFASPLFVETAAQEDMSRVVRTIRAALQDVGKRLRRGEDPLPGHAVYTPTITSERFAFDHGYQELAPIVRLDLAPTEQGPMTLEINTGCPGGEADGGILAQAFFSEPRMAAGIKLTGDTAFMDPRQESLERILAVYEEFRAGAGSSMPARPVIGIVTSEAQREVLRPEAMGTSDYYRAQGYEAHAGDLKDLRARGDRLRLGAGEIHLLYRKFSTISFFKRLRDPEGYPYLEDVYRAYRDHRFCMVNPLSSTLLQDKGLLYVLRRDYPETRSVIPETYLLDEDLPRRDGDLWERVRSGDEFILKRRISYAGKWVVMDPDEARLRIPEMLSREPGKWIVQKRIEPARDFFAVSRDGTIKTGMYAYNVAGFGSSFFVRVSLGGPFDPINAGTGGAETLLLAVHGR